MRKAKYEEIRDIIKPGDVIAFGGSGFMSSVIKVATLSRVSHVGIVPFVTRYGFQSVVSVIESTTMEDGVAGVDIRRLSTKIAKYNGDVWLLRLSRVITSEQFLPFLLSQRGKKYDAPQAILSAIDLIPDSLKNLDRLFCSELVTAALQAAGIVGTDINPSEQTPIDVCRFGCFLEPIQIKGDPKEI